MPRAAEVNPIASGPAHADGLGAKGLLVLLVLGIQPALRPKYSAVGELVAVVAIAAGCVGAGSNLAVLTYVNAAEASRPATQPAPVSIGTTGNEQGTQAPAAEPRTATSRVRRTSPLPVVAAVKAAVRSRPTPPDASVRAGTLRGRASWFGAAFSSPPRAPRSAAHLGRHWRGTSSGVCAGGRCVVVRLVDWCQCYRGRGTERLIDLGDQAFAELAPLEAGLLVVRIRTVELVPPATSTR
jgi:rare lipoprotein A (peptidoglycan hydrolase)